jgi:hypothetical protein
LITEVQLELGFANVTISRDDNHELLSKYFSRRPRSGQICVVGFVQTALTRGWPPPAAGWPPPAAGRLQATRLVTRSSRPPKVSPI